MKTIIGGRYEFDMQTDVIGRGGMGTVYHGKDTQTGNIVAIKQLNHDMATDTFTSRFMREAAVMRRLSHPNILTVHDAISDANLGYFLVMEYIGGGSLWDELQAYPQLPIPRILTLAQDLVSALMIVHQHDIIHRDIKPANVLIADDGTPRLTDFGATFIADKTRLTETGGLIGTLDYLAPELFTSEVITVQADIWALGVMLYEMIGGVRPFAGDSLGTILTNILTKAPPNLADLRPDAPQNLIRLVEWMLMKNPAERVATMTIIHQALSEIERGTNDRLVIPKVAPSGTKIVKRMGSLPKLFADGAFHDRDQQQAIITNAILDGKSLIGVYGRGGIGKTALTCKVLSDFELRGVMDGVAYLRADSTLALNISTLWDKLAEFLPKDHNFHQLKHDTATSTPDKTRALLAGLVGGRYLVYIDNLETLQNIDDYALSNPDMRQFFEALLEAQGSPLTVIITSRYPIPFPNTLKPYEMVVRLDEGLPQEDAIQFLRQIDNQKNLPETDTHLKIWIEKVGGFPRGLEALVGYLSGNPTHEIGDLLADNRLFEGEVLSNIVHHAHQALPQDFRQVMASVAIIGQATSRAELDYLLTPFVDSSRLRVILEKLVDSRFMMYNRQSRTYSLHPIDRDYALSNTPTGAPDEPENTFTRYTLNHRMAEYYRSRRTPRDTWKSLDDLEAVLREMTHRFNAGDYDGVADILLEIDFPYLIPWGYVQLMQTWHSKLEGNIRHFNTARRSIGNLGTAYSIMGNNEEAIIRYEKAIQMAQEQGNRAGERGPLGNLGLTYANMGKLELAINYYEQALAIDRETDYKVGESIRLGNLGNAYAELGDFEKGIAYLQQALEVAKQANDGSGESRHSTNWGYALGGQGKFSEAMPLIQNGLEIAQKINSARDTHYSLAFLAQTYWYLGDYTNALTVIKQARDYDAAFINHAVMVWHGCIAWCSGLADEAQAIFHETLAYTEKTQPKSYDRFYIRALAYAGLWIATGDMRYHADALKMYADAKALCGYAGILQYNRRSLETLLACGDKDGSALIAILQ